MDPNTYIATVARYNGGRSENENVLVSGSDAIVSEYMLARIVEGCAKSGAMPVLIDNGEFINSPAAGVLALHGYKPENLLSGDICIFDPLKISAITGMTRMRQLTGVFAFDEQKKLKLISYLNLLSMLDKAIAGNSEGLTVSKIIVDYGSGTSIEMKLQELVDGGLIDEAQQIEFLAKYAEVADVAPEFDGILFCLSPFADSGKRKLAHSVKAAPVLPLYELDGDDTLKEALLKLLIFSLKELGAEPIHVIITDSGLKPCAPLVDFISSVPTVMGMSLITSDAFMLGDKTALSSIQNRFPIRVYSSHNAESSLSAIEEALGGHEVVMTTYTVSRDRRLGANKPVDWLFGTNKTEIYGQTPPTYKPRYRKEDIAALPNGTAIVQYRGQSCIVSCRQK